MRVVSVGHLAGPGPGCLCPCFNSGRERRDRGLARYDEIHVDRGYLALDNINMAKKFNVHRCVFHFVDNYKYELGKLFVS